MSSIDRGDAVRRPRPRTISRGREPRRRCSRIRLWYSSLVMSSMRWRSASPPGRAKAACSRRPYLASSTCQPLRAEQRLELRGADAGDDAVEALAVEVDDPEHVAEALRRDPRQTASQTLPSSSSASPISATKRLRGHVAEVESRRSGAPAAAKAGATAPSPTEPVEKSTGSGSLVRLG